MNIFKTAYECNLNVETYLTHGPSRGLLSTHSMALTKVWCLFTPPWADSLHPVVSATGSPRSSLGVFLIRSILGAIMTVNLMIFAHFRGTMTS